MKLSSIPNESIKAIHVSRQDRIVSSFCSRGNQLKWKSDDMYIKLNRLGYEDIAEVMVSHLLRFTNIPNNEYVQYYCCRVYEDGVYMGRGCYSYDFTSGLDEITVARLLDETMSSYAIGYDELRDYLYDVTNKDFKDYIDRILCIDSITFNDDRHFNNISLLFDSKKNEYYIAPVFDNGASCLSDLTAYPINEKCEININKVMAKPFNTDFKNQIHNVNRIIIDYDRFVNSVEAKREEEIRAFNVIMHGLNRMERISWERA